MTMRNKQTLFMTVRDKFSQVYEEVKPRNLTNRFLALNGSRRAMVILIAVLLVIVLTTFHRYGFTFDEFKGVLRAKKVLKFFNPSGEASDASGIDMSHGPAPDVLALVLQNLVPPLSYDSRHLVFALFGVAGVYYLYRFGSKFVGEWVGVFAALFLAATPMWFGHMFFNAKDIPFATLLLASSYYSLLALTEPTTSRGLWVKTGVSVGLLASTKFGGLPAFVFVVAAYLACLAMFPSQNSLQLAPDLRRRIASLGLAGLVGCLLCFLVFWPQVYALQFVFREPGANAIFKANQDPYYAATYFIVSTPLFLLVLAVAGVGCALYRREAPIVAAIIVFSSFFLAQALTGFRVYNGSRHFLFLYPFFMLTAAYPVALLLDVMKGSLARVALIGIIALCVAGTLFDMYRLFPYQYSFYNSLVGGFAGADGVYEIDSWRSAHREAIDLIAAKVDLDPGTIVRIRSCASKLNLRTHPNFKLVERNEDADYFIALRRGKKCAFEMFDGLPVVGEVRREGVLLARIYAAR